MQTDEVKKEKRTQISRAMRALVKGGEKFADVAKKFSEGSRRPPPNGGDLGYFPAAARWCRNSMRRRFR